VHPLPALPPPAAPPLAAAVPGRHDDIAAGAGITLRRRRGLAAFDVAAAGVDGGGHGGDPLLPLHLRLPRRLRLLPRRRAPRRRARRLLRRRPRHGHLPLARRQLRRRLHAPRRAQIAAFQGHHRRPSTITRRGTCNNLHALCRAAALALPPAGAALSAASAPAAAHAFAGAFAACVVLSQQFHAWAHEKRRRLPPGVELLQDAGVLVSRAEHAAHHRQPYNSNYCIVSGMWNGVLDRYRVFEALEMVVFFRTGVRPRSWDEVDDSWKEVAGDDVAAAGDEDL
ncbi:unnamed protein product, partial [Urochloa humidicola]